MDEDNAVILTGVTVKMTLEDLIAHVANAVDAAPARCFGEWHVSRLECVARVAREKHGVLKERTVTR